MSRGSSGAGVRRGARAIAASACAVVLATLLAACSEQPKPVYQTSPKPVVEVSAYDPSLEPSAAVLPLIPAEATRLEVTDFDQLRLVLGYGNLDGRSPAADRARFATQARRSTALTQGRLRAADARLRRDFGFGQDDVAWEATWQLPSGSRGWVVALHTNVPMASVDRAVRAGVASLRGGTVDDDRRLVTSGAATDPASSWGAEQQLVRLVGRTAVSTYVERDCIPFATVYGAGVEEQLATMPALRLRRLDRLDAFAVALGGELATVQLGPSRSDAFDRARIADLLPSTTPEFSTVLGRPVADPSTGRIGYTLADPAAAARLVLARTLPFAVCPG